MEYQHNLTNKLIPISIYTSIYIPIHYINVYILYTIHVQTQVQHACMCVILMCTHYSI